MKRLVVPVILLLLPVKQVMACGAIYPFAILSAGETGLLVLLRSLPLLGIVVGVKCVVFAWLARRFLDWRKAVIYMILANIVSTVVSIIASIPFTGFPALLVIIPLFFLFACLPARRYSVWLSTQTKRKVHPSVVVLVICLVFIATILLFYLAMEAMHGFPIEKQRWYWWFKTGYVYTALLLSIGLTIYVEESVIARFAGLSQDDSMPCLGPVARSNFVALLIITVVGVIEVLPRRMESPDFLLDWYH